MYSYFTEKTSIETLKTILLNEMKYGTSSKQTHTKKA
jgi:hypothetical protein